MTFTFFISVLCCNKSYQWEPKYPGKCSRKLWGIPYDVKNGEIVKGKKTLYYNDSVEYQCNLGLVDDVFCLFLVFIW